MTNMGIVCVESLRSTEVPRNVVLAYHYILPVLQIAHSPMNL